MKARTIPGTQSSLIKEELQVKPFSASIAYKEERVASTEEDIPPESISGFVTCKTDGKWWLACVLHLSQDESQVKLMLLHTPGPSSSLNLSKL